MSPMIVIASAINPPAPAPWMPLNTMSSGMFCASPESIEPTRKITIAVWNSARRPKSLLSGLIFCGCCGGPYSLRGAGRFACSSHIANKSCSNSRTIPREELERILRADEPLAAKCRHFIDAARAAGAPDNVTAVLLRTAGLTNRAADVWEPLLAIADLAGGRWPELARQAAVGLTATARERSPIGALLFDIAVLFIMNDAERLFSRDIVT